MRKENRIRRRGASVPLYGNAAANPEGCQAERCGKQQNDTQEYNSTFFFIVLLSFSDAYAADDVHYLKQLKTGIISFILRNYDSNNLMGIQYATTNKNNIRHHGRYRIRISSNTGKISYTDGEIQRLIIMEKF